MEFAMDSLVMYRDANNITYCKHTLRSSKLITSAHNMKHNNNDETFRVVMWNNRIIIISNVCIK